jgi:putative oxidoreductase
MPVSTPDAGVVDLTNAGLLTLRLLLGLVVIGHGIQKVSFRLGGGGLEAEAAVLAKDGVRGGRLSAAVSGVSQVGAGVLCSLGLLTFLGAAGVIGVMTVASATKLRHGFWVQNDGYEFPLFLCLTGIVLALSGPGAWSLDHVISLNGSLPTSVGAIALGAVSGCISAALLRQPRDHPGGQETRPNDQSVHS